MKIPDTLFAKETPPIVARELTDAQLAWVWPHYQCCSFTPATFAKRFARNEFDRLTDKGKVMAISLCFQYRRQIFGKKAAKWTREQFMNAVRVAAAPKGETPEFGFTSSRPL